MEEDTRKLLIKAETGQLTSEERLRLLKIMNEAVTEFRNGLRKFKQGISK